MQQGKIKINKTATYYTEGDIKTAQTIWVVLHGYGMLAAYFIRKFQPIINDSTYVIAPEGLSKFYSKGFYGRVGATWMTKQDRADEIEDYTNYLNQLYDTIIAKNNCPEVKVNVVGFSQGGATASRWIANGHVTPTNFILWSSIFPDEMELKTFGKDFNTFLLWGDNDKFSNAERITEYEQLLKESAFKLKLIMFNGGHDIPNKVLQEQTLKNKWQ